MAADDYIELEIMRNRFNRLMSELLRGAVTRNAFFPWEVEILLDLDGCQLERRRRTDILGQYQKAVARQMEIGPGPPMKLSEFLEIRNRRREAAGRSNGPALQPDHSPSLDAVSLADHDA
jgi:hypothetical protein